MKIFRRFLPLFAVLFVLSGCSGPAKSQLEQAIAFRTRLLGAAGCRFSAVVTADYGDRRYTFETDCAADREEISLLLSCRRRAWRGSPEKLRQRAEN